MKRVGILLVLTCCSLSSAHAQGWRDLVNKAKEKAKQAAGVGDTAATVRNAQTAHAPPSQQWYMYCSTPGAKFEVYRSKIFPVAHDPKTILADDSAWKSFAKARYGVDLQHRGALACAQFPSEQQARDSKVRGDTALAIENRNQPEQYRYTISEIDWTPESAPSVGASPAPTVIQRQAPTRAAAVTTGPLVYTYCFVDTRSPITMYVSAVFPIHQQDRQSIFNTIVPAFRRYLSDRYQLSGRPGGYGCEDGFPTEAQATTRLQADLTRSRSAPSVQGVIETGWMGGDRAGTLAPNQATGPRADATGTESGQRSAEITRVIEAEPPHAKSICESTISLVNYYDCSCVSQQAHAARLRDGVTFATAPGGGRIVEPPLSGLIGELDLRACVAPDKITAYATKYVARMFSIPAERRPSMAACTSQKLVDQMKSDPYALRKEDNFMSQDLSDCHFAAR